MARFPYMNFPFPFYKSYPRTPSNFYNFTNSQMPNTQTPNAQNAQTPNAQTSTYANSAPANTGYNSNIDFSRETNYNSDRNDNTRNFEHKNKSNKIDDTFLFDLFGLKIYNDDVLLVSLLYFLYSEGVKDDGLFLVLILLLLS